MAAHVRSNADDVSFRGHLVNHEPTVEIEGSVDLDGDWILRRYKNGATEQVLFLERKIFGPNVMQGAFNDERESVRERPQPASRSGPKGSRHGYIDGSEKNVTDQEESFERRDPKKPGTRGNSFAAVDETKSERRALQSTRPQIPESPNQEESAPTQNGVAAKCSKRRASADTQEVQARQKKLKAANIDKPTKGQKQHAKNRRLEEEGEQEQATIPDVAEAPVDTGGDEATGQQLENIGEKAEDVPVLTTSTNSENHRAVWKKKPKELPKDDDAMEDIEVSESVESAKEKPTAKTNKAAGRTTKKAHAEEDEQTRSSSEDDGEDITVPIKSETEPGDNIVVKHPSREVKKQ
ncbi:hypothetical protein DOTSEDRAFT_20366 [Dothistroma septosporum NZE10]|uniref:Uncharacterized protein n=1 Tax=Dothistroma septosporum (strain NZE10 / CBS 128990) TaxID=675120 RepID=N1Q534_DOTSN|nr:hypothetical protein DOTSEDRAFT_20366 [Dothistroma septosporum NZE10]